MDRERGAEVRAFTAWRAVAVLGIASSGLLGVASCSGSSGDPLSGGVPPSSAGKENGPCIAKGTGCTTGLVCIGDRCVKGAEGGTGDPPIDAGAAADATNGGACEVRPSTGDNCSPGDCRCGQASACFAASVAAKCCNGQPVTCKTAGGGDPDGGQCAFKHPLLDAGARYCGTGDCYCETRDSCYSAASAAACCPAASMTCY